MWSSTLDVYAYNIKLNAITVTDGVLSISSQMLHPSSFTHARERLHITGKIVCAYYNTTHSPPEPILFVYPRVNVCTLILMANSCCISICIFAPASDEQMPPHIPFYYKCICVMYKSTHTIYSYNNKMRIDICI